MIFKGINEPLIIDVRKDEYERIKTNLDSPDFDLDNRVFFNCSSLDGKLYSINLKHLQFIHFLWDPVGAGSDRLRYEGPIQICLLNQKNLIEADSDAPGEIYDFFKELESDDGYSFKGFTDMDGELLYFQANEIVYASTPEDLYEEGSEIAFNEIEI